MASLFPFLFLAPLCYAMAILLDKKIVSSGGEETWLPALLAVGGAFNWLAALGVGCWMSFAGQGLTLPEFWPLAANGITYWLAMGAYAAAMQREEATRVAPILQMLPVFGIIADVFVLHNMPGSFASIGIACVMLGCLLLNLRQGRLNKQVLLLMVLATIMLAINDTIFARFGRGLGTAPAIFADLTGKAAWGLLPLLLPRARRGFVLGFRKFLWLFALVDTLTIAADGIADVGKLYFPVSVIQAVDCTQEIFMLAGVFLFSHFAPRFLSEKLDGVSSVQKLTGCGVVVFGGVLIAMGQGGG